MKLRSARKIQKKKKFINRGSKKVIYRSLLALSLFLLSLVFLGGYMVYQRLNKPFASASSSNSDSYELASDRVPTLVYAVVSNLEEDPLVISDLKYLVFDKSDKKVLVYRIPVDYRFDIAGKYGEEELSKVLALGAMNSESPFNGGTNVLKNTILKIFGFKVDKYVVVSSRSRSLFDDLLGNGSFLDLLKLSDFIKSGEEFKTDLTLEEFYNLFTFVKSIPNDRLITQTLTLKDLIDPAAIEVSFEDIGLVSYVAEESKSISVLNGTDVSGVAALGARVVKNMGGRVVALGNADKTYSLSVIVADDPNSQTCRFLSSVFNIKNIVSKADNIVQEHEVDRSDIVVIMGFDTTEKLY